MHDKKIKDEVASSRQTSKLPHPDKAANSPSTRNYNENVFLTRDLLLSAYFKAKGLEFLGTKQSEHGTVFFMFRESAERETLIREFFSGTTFIGEYRSSIAELKSLIGQGRVL